MDLKGKVALVTGGAVRIGRALTLALAKAGCDLFIHYGRSTNAAQQTQKEAEALGAKATIYSANLADVQATQTILPTAIAHYGRVHILINSAAIFPDNDTFNTLDTTLWDKTININLRAPFLLSQAFAAQTPQNIPRKIINILDARLRNTMPDHFIYRLAKSGLWHMTEMMAHELAPYITVNAVALGAILPPPGADETYLHHIAQERIPLCRPGNTNIVAQNVLHLLRQDFLTGVILPLDGGEFL